MKKASKHKPVVRVSSKVKRTTYYVMIVKWDDKSSSNKYELESVAMKVYFKAIKDESNKLVLIKQVRG